jgi:O-antigen ligase
VKWPFIFLAVLAILPFSQWLRANPGQTPRIWLLLGVFPFFLDAAHLQVAVVSWALWPGFFRGVEFSAIDVIALSLYLSLPHARNSVPFRFAMGAYFFAVLLSIFQAGVQEATFFYLIQLARVFFLIAVISKACADERVAPAILNGMAIGICLEACIVIWQRFALGQFQADGTFLHQNSLGMAIHFVVFPFLAMLLAGKRGWQPRLVPVAGIIIALLTVSRATLGLAIFGYVALFLISALRKWSSRKGGLAIAGVITVVCLAPIGFSSLEARFAAHPFSADYDERAAFESAAASMLSDHPMGVGANNYVVVANMRGYNERAGVIPTPSSLGATVHNMYFLVAAETGYLGLVTFLLLLLRPLVVAFVSGWRDRQDLRGDILLGLGVSLLMVYLHSLYEWVFVTYYSEYLFAIETGLIAGLAQRVGYLPGIKAKTFNKKTILDTADAYLPRR